MREEVILFVLCPWLFLLVSFFCRFCLKLAMHSGKIYMHHYGQFGAQGTLPPLSRLFSWDFCYPLHTFDPPVGIAVYHL